VAILTPAPRNFQQKIRSELTEALQLSYYDIIPSILHLRVTLAGTGARPAVVNPGSASDIYRVAGDYNFLIGEIRAHVAMNQLGSEDTVGATGLNSLVGTRNRTVVKALNAKAFLVNPDRNDLRFVETDIQNSSSQFGGSVISPLSLASLMPEAGGSPVSLIGDGYVMPLIVPSNERIKMTIVLLDPNATLGQTEYGLTCIGALVRAR
jgi:hypothetical protein